MCCMYALWMWTVQQKQSGLEHYSFFLIDLIWKKVVVFLLCPGGLMPMVWKCNWNIIDFLFITSKMFYCYLPKKKTIFLLDLHTLNRARTNRRQLLNLISACDFHWSTLCCYLIHKKANILVNEHKLPYLWMYEHDGLGAVFQINNISKIFREYSDWNFPNSCRILSNILISIVLAQFTE